MARMTYCIRMTHSAKRKNRLITIFYGGAQGHIKNYWNNFLQNIVNTQGSVQCCSPHLCWQLFLQAMLYTPYLETGCGRSGLRSSGDWSFLISIAFSFPPCGNMVYHDANKLWWHCRGSLLHCLSVWWSHDHWRWKFLKKRSMLKWRKTSMTRSGLMIVF